MCSNPITIKINGEEKKVKCGKCEICRARRAKDWSIRLICEAKYHKKVSFITLTFDNKILLSKDKKINKYKAETSFIFHINNSKEYFKKFIKRLRKKYKDKYISYYHIGEYGEKTKRPHHHAIIFGINFEEDRKETNRSKTGHIQYESTTLNELWGAGKCTIQDANENNIIYSAQYINKKQKMDKRYKSIFSFSNRSKISQKWAIRNHQELRKGYIETKDKKKFPIPETFKNLIKKRINLYDEYNLRDTLIQIENKAMEAIKNEKEYKEMLQRKAKILKIREEKKSRDF